MRWPSHVRLPGSQAWRIGPAQGGSRHPAHAPGSAAARSTGRGSLSPAGIDWQINGGLGLAFPELQPSDLPTLLELLELLWRDGVEAISPTVTRAVVPLREALEVLQQARLQHRSGRRRLLGAHLEGPFLAHGKRGAHPAEHLATPSLEALEARIGGHEAEIALVTLAPELPGPRRSSPPCALGASWPLQYSEATAEQASRAFDQGVGLLTRLQRNKGLQHRSRSDRRGGPARGHHARLNRRWGPCGSHHGGPAAVAGARSGRAGQ